MAFVMRLKFLDAKIFRRATTSPGPYGTTAVALLQSCITIVMGTATVTWTAMAYAVNWKPMAAPTARLAIILPMRQMTMDPVNSRLVPVVQIQMGAITMPTQPYPSSVTFPYSIMTATAIATTILTMTAYVMNWKLPDVIKRPPATTMQKRQTMTVHVNTRNLITTVMEFASTTMMEMAFATNLKLWDVKMNKLVTSTSRPPIQVHANSQKLITIVTAIALAT